MDFEFLKAHPETAKYMILQVKVSELLDFADRLAHQTAKEVQATVKAENRPDELLTRQQVAEMLNVTYSTLWHWNNKGILPIIKIGNKVRYRRSDVEKALKK